MEKPRGIMVFGANGSGKTTLGRELACILNFKFIDVEAYFFEESEIPYTAVRSREEVIKLMLDDIFVHGSFVLASCMGNYGDEIPLYYELAVYMEAPLELRLQRVIDRTYKRFGERACKGGDMYEQECKFYDFVASRPLSDIEEWGATLSCPVIRVDGTEDWRVNAWKIAEWWVKREME